MSTVTSVLIGLTVFFVLVIAGFLIFNGGTSAKTGTVKGWINKWWAGLDSESSPGQRFVLLCGALLLAYGELRWRGTVWAALILLLFAALIKPPKSKITLAFVWLDLSLVILAGFFSGVLGMRSSTADIVDTWFTKKSVAMAQYAKDYKEGKLPQETETELPLTKTIAVSVPTDDVVVFTAPQGYRLSSMECPAENVIEIQIPGTKSVLRQIDCAGQITIGENEVLNKEFVVFQKPGSDEPSQVITWWKKV